MILAIPIIFALILGVFWPEKEVFGNFLSKDITSIEKYIDHSDVINDQVSKGSVGWHLDHVLMVINSIHKQLEKSDPSSFKHTINFTRTLVFTIHEIPRGRGKSPDRVRPKDDVSMLEITNHLKDVKRIINEFDSLPKEAYFDHPYFGMLNRQQTKKFIQIHTNHHLKIVKDILNR